MKIGVKFCGGCNPRYDRGAYYKDTVSANPQYEFMLAEEGKKYDNLLVIGGCPACCASHEQYAYDTLTKIWSDNGVPKLPEFQTE